MASVGSVIDFGLNYVKGQIFGFLHNDVGAGISGVVILLGNNGVTQRALSGDDGSFQFRGLAEGSYTLSSTVESYPAGYNLQNVVDKFFDVKPGAPMRAEFMVRALRSIAGIVSGYDALLLKSGPRHGVIVRIPQLGIQTKTDATGHYIFRRLPAGKLTLIAGESAGSLSLEVEVPPQPAEIHDINFMLK